MTNSKRGGRSTALRPAASGGGKGGDSPNSERRKGEKGAGKGDGKKGAAKGGGKGKKGEAKNGSMAASAPPQERHVAGAKTVQELEAEMLRPMGGATTKERREASKHPLEVKGAFCEVKKHSDMGCAVVSFKVQAVRDSVMALAAHKAAKNEKSDDKRPSLKVSGVDVQLRPHFDKAAQEEVKNDIFVAWGRQEEKKANLPAQTIAEAIDLLVIESRGGQLTPENALGSPLMAPGQPLSPMQVPQMPPMQLPQPLTQLLQSPMVPGPQQQQVNYADYIQYAWATQQQQAAQQQAAAQQMQPPPSPSPATSPAAAVLETPPRQGALKMRADAPQFTPPPVQQFGASFTDQSQYINELEQYAGFDYNQMGTPEKTSKQFKIVDPKSGQTIETPKVNKWPGFEPPQPPERKPIKIVDPNNGTTVDTLGMIFTPAKDAKNFSIIDPKSGRNIQV